LIVFCDFYKRPEEGIYSHDQITNLFFHAISHDY